MGSSGLKLLQSQNRLPDAIASASQSDQLEAILKVLEARDGVKIPGTFWPAEHCERKRQGLESELQSGQGHLASEA